MANLNNSNLKPSGLNALPDNISQIVRQLTEKHNLKEPGEGVLECLEKKHIVPEIEIIDLLVEVAEGTTKKENISLELKKRLGISKIKAENLTRDLKESFFETKKKEEPKKSKQRDIYREPTE